MLSVGDIQRNDKEALARSFEEIIALPESGNKASLHVVTRTADLACNFSIDRSQRSLRFRDHSCRQLFPTQPAARPGDADAASRKHVAAVELWQHVFGTARASLDGWDSKRHGGG